MAATGMMATGNRRSERGMLGMIIAAAVGAAALAASVAAQDALGGGNALDANLNTQGSTNTRVPSTAIDYQLRNLVVTGDVAAGRGFRGAVGYSAPGDFRGELGSDDTFAFRANTALSSPEFITYRSQLQQLSLGSQIHMLEFRRATAVPSTGDLSQVTPGRMRSDFHALQLQVDRLAAEQALAETVDDGAEPLAIGAVRTADGRMMVLNAGSLRGLSYMPLEDQLRLDGIDTIDRMYLMDDVRESRLDRERLGQPTDQQSLADTLRLDLRVAPDATGERVELLQDVAQRFGPNFQEEDETLDRFQTQYERLRQQLAGEDGDEAPPGEQGVDELEPGPTRPPLPGEETQPEDTTAGDGEDPDPFDNPLRPREEPTPGHFEALIEALRHGQRVDHLASDGDDRINELLRGAEERLAEEDYFWAERRFARVLRLQPNHPMALAGMANAQIGAGLYQSAAATLRTLLTRFPEMIDTTYAEELLPSRVRLLQVVEALRARIERLRDPSVEGLLLAYLGHQLDDESLREEGLASMRQGRPGDPLLPVLEQLWTQDAQEPAETADDEAGADAEAGAGPEADSGRGADPQK